MLHSTTARKLKSSVLFGVAPVIEKFTDLLARRECPQCCVSYEKRTWILRVGPSLAKLDKSYRNVAKSAPPQYDVCSSRLRATLACINYSRRPVAEAWTKRKRQYKPSESQPRTFPSCGKSGHFASSCSSPIITLVAYSTQDKAEKASAKIIIDFTQTNWVDACSSVVGEGVSETVSSRQWGECRDLPVLIRQFALFCRDKGDMMGRLCSTE